MLWGLITILLIVVGMLAVRLYAYRKQVSHLIEELSLWEQEMTNYELTSCCPIGDTPELIMVMNQVMHKHKQLEASLRKENRIYKESITGISHDIRTPLTSSKGYIQLLRDENIPEEKKREYVDIVIRRLDDVADMLSQLFEYARIEAGELKLELQVFSASNVFAETIALFYEDFVKAGFEPRVEISNEPCYIEADKRAFIRIIENLMKNALVHGTGGYRISFLREDNKAVIRISNQTGSITEKEIGYIFDRFYTNDESRSRRATGLGLSIVKRFSEQMGGETKAFLEGDYFTIEVSFYLKMDEVVHRNKN